MATQSAGSVQAEAFMDDGERESPVFRDFAERPIVKLSVQLIETYKNINKGIVRSPSHRPSNSPF